MNTRDYRFDNIKGIMIFLVVFCHLIEKFQLDYLNIALTKHLYFAVYSFHMPVFIFISGYFAGKSKGDRRYKSLTRYLIPYLVVNTAYDVFYTLSTKSLVFNPFYPRWILWFLLSMFFWHVFIDYIKLIRYPVVVAILLGLLAGWFNDIGYFLSLSRTICFFPFFVAGYYTQSNKAILEPKRRTRLIIITLFIVVQVIIFIMAQKNVIINTFYLSLSYDEMRQPIAFRMLYRLIVYAAGFIGTLFFLSVIPNEKTFLSEIGRYSITVYLAHQLIIVVLNHFFTGFSSPVVTLPAAAVLSVLICLAFGNKYINKLYQAIFDRINRFLIPTPQTFR